MTTTTTPNSNARFRVAVVEYLAGGGTAWRYTYWDTLGATVSALLRHRQQSRNDPDVGEGVVQLLVAGTWVRAGVSP